MLHEVFVMHFSHVHFRLTFLYPPCQEVGLEACWNHHVCQRPDDIFWTTWPFFNTVMYFEWEMRYCRNFQVIKLITQGSFCIYTFDNITETLFSDLSSDGDSTSECHDGELNRLLQQVWKAGRTLGRQQWCVSAQHVNHRAPSGQCCPCNL